MEKVEFWRGYLALFMQILARLLTDAPAAALLYHAQLPMVYWCASLAQLPRVPGFVPIALVQDAQNAQERDDQDFTMTAKPPPIPFTR